jgi:DNA recombination protein RmuC
MDLLAGAVAALALALVVLVTLIGRRAVGTRDAQAMASVARDLGRLQQDLATLARGQDELRREVQGGREASLLQLSQAAQAIRGELFHTHRALAEVKALEQGRARQLDLAADSLRRLEAVLAGSASRGAAGENILARALTQLPPDLLEVNVAFGSKVVEYALRLPGGRLLPIDSKWPSAAALDRLQEAGDAQERRRLAEQVGRELRARIREVGKYLDPERTLSIGLLAVPDAVCAAAPEALGDGYRDGVLVVPYSLALPYVLALYRLTLRFGTAVDADQLAERLRCLEESLRRSSEEVESRLSRALVQMENARDALREHLAGALRATGRMREGSAEVLPESPALN